MLRYWRLNEQNVPEELHGTLKWASDPRSHVKICHTKDGNVLISTVFLGLGDMFTGRPYFETMIFDGPLDMYQERCGTYVEALEQHRLAVELHIASLTERRIKDGD